MPIIRSSKPLSNGTTFLVASLDRTLDSCRVKEYIRNLILFGVVMRNERDRIIELLLAEYKAAQDSAQHHDNLLWYVSSIVWGGNLILLGSFLKNIGNATGALSRSFIFYVGIFCILLNLCLWGCACLFRNIRNQKYDQCKFIESKLGFRQHSDLRCVPGLMWFIYSFVTIMFMALWFLVVFFLR